MTENKKYCMGCMKEIDIDASVCPHCYYNEESVQHYPCLPKGTLIAERYISGRAISMTNDSITYIGIDTQTEETVSVHEFFPAKIAERAADGCEVNVKLGYDDIFGSCVQSFISMWKAIGSVKGEISLPTVRNILDFNGTVYAICKYSDSITLKSYFEETRKPLPWQKAHSAFKSIFSALDKLHGAGVIHGSISPSSVHVGSDGKLHLTAFSIPECRSQNEYLAAAPINGFSALELYGENRVAETGSDVYSLMALIYYCVTGMVPPKATDRAVKDDMVIPSSVAASLPKKVVTAFIRGLAVAPENRVRSVAELSSVVYASDAPVGAARNRQTATPAKRNAQPVKTNTSAANKSAADKKKKKSKDSSLAVLALGTFTAVVVICMIVFCVLYTTVLYKNYDVPVLNDAFASFDFLPMNQGSSGDDTTLPAETTQAPVAENRYVTVPDFTAHTYDSITTNSTFTQNFKMEFTFEYNDKVAKNAVISQDLVKGESVLAGTTVKLVISRGAEKIELPEVIGLQYSDAESELKDKGFKVKKVLLENDGTHTEGIVEMTDLVAGLEFDKGTEIILSVWDEYEEETTEETTKKEKKNKDKKSDKKTTEKKNDSE
ncbi:MAG: PASTA domain-containing protein [Ruminococcaceae bacterium]|nr:PASTA domain-containing protein [Oscillospiraceae bacterium]